MILTKKWRIYLGEKIERNNDREIILLTVGRLIESKGYDLALQACKVLKEKNFPIKWYVIGEGNQRKNIEQKMKEFL